MYEKAITLHTTLIAKRIAKYFKCFIIRLVMSVLRPLDSEKPLPAKIDLAVMFAYAPKIMNLKMTVKGITKPVSFSKDCR